MTPLVRGLRETAPGRAEMKEQNTTKGFAAQGPGQLYLFECHRAHGMDKKPFSKITQKYLRRVMSGLCGPYSCAQDKV